MNKNTRYFFAIRHKPSGGFLPQMTSYGFTRCTPTLTEPPRLFSKHGPARQALDRWLQGEWTEVGFSEDDEVKLKVVPKSDRRSEDLEIVEVEITATSLADSKLRLL